MKKIKDDNTFHGRLKKVRKALGYTQETFSPIVSVSKPTLVRYEAGERRPDSDILEILAKDYNVDMNWLVMGTGDMFVKDSGIFVDCEDSELCELIRLMAVPQIRRSVMAEFDMARVIFKPMVDAFLTGKEEAGVRAG